MSVYVLYLQENVLMHGGILVLFYLFKCRWFLNVGGGNLLKTVII